MMAKWISDRCTLGARFPLRQLGLGIALLALTLLATTTSHAAPQGCVAGPHNTDITTDQEWCLSDSPHYVNGGRSVAAGVTLTIQPGVKVLFGPGSNLQINGALIAEGTPAQPITLTAQSTNWAGIGANNGSRLRLAYVDIGNVGSDVGPYSPSGLTVVAGADTQVRHSRLHGWGLRGLNLFKPGPTNLTGQFEDLEIDHNGYAMYQSTINMSPTYTNLRLHDNVWSDGTNSDILGLPSDTVTQDVTLDGSPAALNGAPIASNGVDVAKGSKLTITPGTVLKLVAGTALQSHGTLIAEGTAEHRITFAPWSTNWAGITAWEGSQLRLAYADIGNVGSDLSQYSPSGLTVVAGADAQVRHSRLHGWGLRGLNLFKPGPTNLTGQFEDLEIDHNGYAMYQSTINMSPTYTNLHLHDNVWSGGENTDGLFLPPDTVTQDVTLDGSPAALNGALIASNGVMVDQGHTLTITPGTHLKFGPGTALQSHGTLIALGTAEHPITFAPWSTNWAGVTAWEGSQLRLAYVDVGNVGSDAGQNGVTVFSGADAQVRHGRIHHFGKGLVLFNRGLTGAFEDLEIDHNIYAVWQTTINMNPTFVNLRLHDNVLAPATNTDAVFLPPETISLNVTLDGSPAALNGAPFYVSGASVSKGYTLTVTPGSTLKIAAGQGLGVDNGATLIAEGTAAHPITLTAWSGNWWGVRADGGSRLRLAYCDVSYAGGHEWHYSVMVSTSDAQINGCRVHHSLGDGLVVNNNGRLTVRNLALIDNAWSGLALTTGARVDGLHLTMARNAVGVLATSGTTVLVTNTILAANTTGVNVATGGSATLNRTLWDNNTTPIVGAVNDIGHVDGPARFAADGYHLTLESAALERGLNAGVTDDIDGQTRPLPVGSLPDLGADEYPYTRLSLYAYLPLVVR